MDRHETFMTEAIKLAVENVRTGRGGPFGAIVVKDGKIIGRGVNSVTASFDPTSHAEVNAIRDACKTLNDFQLADCDIYTSCEPCPMCFGAIYWARPRKVYFAAGKEDAAHAGFDDSLIYDEIQKEFAERQIFFQQIMRGEAVEIFNEWNSKDDKVRY